MVSKCCICKKKAWCFDDDGKTPYCKECWDKSHKDLSLAEASKPIIDGYNIANKDFIKFLQVLCMSGGINDVAMKKVFEKIEELKETLNKSEVEDGNQ